MNAPQSINLPDAEVLYRNLAQQLATHCAQFDHIQLVGIFSGGAWIAHRLHADLKLSGAIGTLNASLHRDDFAERGLQDHTHGKASVLPFSVEESNIILIDDVLNTGRTIRAALNELYDFGRPKKIWLATLVDRGGRELPIQADFTAHKFELDASYKLKLRRNEQQQLYFSVDHV